MYSDMADVRMTDIFAFKNEIIVRVRESCFGVVGAKAFRCRYLGANQASIFFIYSRHL